MTTRTRPETRRSALLILSFSLLRSNVKNVYGFALADSWKGFGHIKRCDVNQNNMQTTVTALISYIFTVEWDPPNDLRNFTGPTPISYYVRPKMLVVTL